MKLRFSFRYSVVLACALVFILTMSIRSRLLQSDKIKSKVPSVKELKPNILNDNNRCYYKSPDANDTISYLDNILDAEKRPKPGKAIFFHKTSCSETGVMKLNAK